MDGDVLKKEAQDRVLAKKPYKAGDLRSLTACFLHPSDAVCAIVPVRALVLPGSVLLSGCWGSVTSSSLVFPL